MSKPVPSRWKAGQSGNRKGRPRNTRTLTELLRQEGDEIMQVGDSVLTRHEVLAKAMWQYVLTGEVKLAGETLKAKNAGEWVQAIKWLTERLEPSGRSMKPEPAPEMVVRVIRTDKTRPRTSLAIHDAYDAPLDPFPEPEV